MMAKFITPGPFSINLEAITQVEETEIPGRVTMKVYFADPSQTLTLTTTREKDCPSYWAINMIRHFIVENTYI